MTNIIFHNAQIADLELDRIIPIGYVVCKDGIIEKVVEGKLPSNSDYDGYEKIDCKEKVLCPAFIELQTHVNEPNGSFYENIEISSKAAIAGGIATINIMPDTSPSVDSTSIVEYLKSRVKEKSKCHITISGSITKGLQGQALSEIGLMKKAGIRSISDSTYCISDSDVMRKACLYAKSFDMPLLHQPDDCNLSQDSIVNEGLASTELGLKGNPDIAEKIGLLRDITIAEETGVKYHALNISSAKAVAVLRKIFTGEGDGNSNLVNISASVTPQHLLLTEAETYKYRTYAKTYPPLRTEADRQELIQAVKDGIINIVSCNSVPKGDSHKRLPMAQADFGCVGLETLFSATYTALKDKLSLCNIIKLISLNPAILLGLSDRGLIKAGYKAHLTIVDIDTKYIVNPERFIGKARNSAFDEKELTGRVVACYC